MTGPLPYAPRPVGPRRRHIAVAAVTAVAAAGAALLLLGRPSSPAASQRSALRVACAESPAGCALAESIALDVWSEHRSMNEPLDVVLDEAGRARLTAAGVAFDVIEADIDAAARREAERLASPAAQSADFFAEFRDGRAIEARLRALAEEHPTRASLHGIGSTLDGRTLWALRVGGAQPDALPMLINGTQHAREWIAAMTATCVADRLVRDYDKDPAVRALVDTTEVWLVPVVNPDGYQYSWGQDRYWRKNRRGGHGVDLNRNFSVAFGGQGSSGFKRSDVYRGERPFSEPETTALRDLAKREQVRLHIDFHAYGQLVLFPWNHSTKKSDDHARFAAIGDQVASAIYAQHDNRYRLIRGVELYAAAGTMTDWMYGEAGATSFTIELRPRSGGGFVLPPDQIRPTCDEGMAAVLALRASAN
jgi:carboxypeptidase T